MSNSLYPNSSEELIAWLTSLFPLIRYVLTERAESMLEIMLETMLESMLESM